MAVPIQLEAGGPILLETGYPILLEAEYAPIIIVVPNGRWCVAWDMSAYATAIRRTRPVLGEVGFTLYFVTPYADHWSAGMTFIKPSGEMLQVDRTSLGFGLPIPQFSDATFVWYVFGPGDLDEVGRWYVSLTGGSGIGYFYVGLPSSRRP